MKPNKVVRTASIIITIVVLAVINTIALLVGKAGNAQHDVAAYWVALACSNVMVILEEILVILETKDGKSVLYRVFGLPMHTWALGSTIIQLIFLTAIVIVNRFVDAKLLVATIIFEVLLFAFLIIRVVVGFVSRNLALKTDERLSHKTDLFKSFGARVKVIAIDVKEEELKKEVEELGKEMRYLVAVNNAKTEVIDMQIDEKLSEMELKAAKDQLSKDDLAELKVLLNKREILVKTK